VSLWLVLPLCLAVIPPCLAQAPPALADILERVGDRVADYYRHAQKIVCTERVLAQPMDSSFRTDGFARSLEYELHVESDTDGDGGAIGDAKVVRELRKVNGRPPRAKDKPGCFDPNPLSPEALAFLLPGHRGEYTFTSAARGKGKDSHSLLIEFVRIETGKPEFIEDPNGRPECFQLSVPMSTKGRVWVDAATYDVLRVEQRLMHQVDFRVPIEQQRKRHMPDSITIERHETNTRYGVVKFSDPEEALLLPESIEELTIMRGAGSHRKSQQFSDYRRFLTGARVVK
jgi:hypothetical protein